MFDYFRGQQVYKMGLYEYLTTAFFSNLQQDMRVIQIFLKAFAVLSFNDSGTDKLKN